jgi:tetratricopeptide (TPR) repeat protein
MMNKKKKLILTISGIAGCLALLFVIKFIIDGQYRKQLPELPDLQAFPKSLQEQILAADRRAYLNPTANNLGRLGMVYHSSVNYEKATLCYKLAVMKNSRKWIWSYYLGYLNMELGESNASIENFKHVIEKNPKNYLALFYSAEAYQNLDLTVNAENIFKKIAALNDNDFINRDTIRENDFSLQTYALFNLARIYMVTNQYKAEMTLREIIENHMTFGPAYRLLGSLYTRNGNLTLGNKYTIRANDLVEYTPPADILVDKIALMSRSDTYLLKQIDDALRSLNFNWEIKLFDHALKYIPDNKFLISKALFGYFSLNYDKKALPYLDQHFKLFSDDFDELCLIATVLIKKGYNSQAMKYFNQAKKLEPENSRLALWLCDRRMVDEAINLLTEQIKKDPENIKSLTDAVRMFYSLGKREMAMEYLADLNNLSPASLEVIRLTGEMQEKDGNLVEAISSYEKAMRMDPKDLFIIRHLANIYIQEKLWDKAINHFKSALTNYPNEPFLLDGLGNLLINCPEPKLRNVEEGREYAERTFINFKSCNRVCNIRR